MKEGGGLIRHISFSDAGLVRDVNEDSLLVHEPEGSDGSRFLFAVADGVGGGEFGQVASRLCVDTLRETCGSRDGDDPAMSMSAALKKANRVIGEKGRSLGASVMATTCTAMSLAGPVCVIAHAGDSRAYLFRGGMLSLLTEDDTLSGNESVAGGITKAVGAAPTLTPSLYEYEAACGDRFLLCTDGVHSYIGAEAIRHAMSAGGIAEAAARLASQVNAAGAPDNFTAIIVQA